MSISKNYPDIDIVALLESGIPLTILSQESGISLEELQQMKREMSQEGSAINKMLQAKQRKKDEMLFYKMKKMYHRLYTEASNQQQSSSMDELARLEDEFKAISQQKGGSYLERHSKMISLQSMINTIKSNAMKQETLKAEPAIEQIIHQLANGTLTDILGAKKIIAEQAQSDSKNGSKSIFALKPEQQIIKIHMQIKTILEKKFQEFDILNPKVTISQMSQLLEVSEEECARIVLNNLLEARKLEDAQKIYETYRNAIQEGREGLHRGSIERKISNIRIGDMILEAFNKASITSDEIEKIMVQIYSELRRRKNRDISAIPLGWNQNRTRRISLADVWKEPEIMR